MANIEAKVLEDAVKAVTDFFDKKAKVTAKENDGRWDINIESEESGLLIGRGGINIAPFQYIVRLIAAKKVGEYVPLSLDIAGYKTSHQNELEELAKQVAINVKNSGYAQEMRPMTPYERRLVHVALENAEGVKVYSVGDDKTRRIRIEPA